MPGKWVDFSFTEDSEALDLTDGEVKFTEPIKIRLAATYCNGKVILKVSLRMRVSLECSRCLKLFSLPLESEFEEELQVNDDEAYINAANLIRDSIVTGFPLKPLCHISCKGLCAVCGANLNKKQCDCRQEQVDHRLAVLEKLLERE